MKKQWTHVVNPKMISARKMIKWVAFACLAWACLWLSMHTQISSKDGLPAGFIRITYKDKIVKSGSIVTLRAIAVHSRGFNFLIAGGKTLAHPSGVTPYFGPVRGAPYRWAVDVIDEMRKTKSIHLIDENSGEMFKVDNPGGDYLGGLGATLGFRNRQGETFEDATYSASAQLITIVDRNYPHARVVIDPVRRRVVRSEVGK